MLTKQANDSWSVYFAMRARPRGAGIFLASKKNNFSLRSRAFQCESPRVSARQQMALVLRRVSGGFCPMLLLMACCSFSFCGCTATSPGLLQHLSKRVFPFLRAIFKELHERRASLKKIFLKLVSRSCVSGCGRFLAHLMVKITVPRAWAISTLRQRSWMSHVLIVET